MKNNNTLSYRVEQLEKNYDKLDVKMSKLLENDIPHLQETMVGLKTRVSVLTAVNIGAIIFGIVAARLIP
jgi:hypothetical protein